MGKHGSSPEEMPVPTEVPSPTSPGGEEAVVVVVVVVVVVAGVVVVAVVGQVTRTGNNQQGSGFEFGGGLGEQ